MKKRKYSTSPLRQIPHKGLHLSRGTLNLVRYIRTYVLGCTDTHKYGNQKKVLAVLSKCFVKVKQGHPVCIAYFEFVCQSFAFMSILLIILFTNY